MRPLPPTYPRAYPTLMVHDLTPPLSPTTSIGSARSPATPICPNTPTFVDDHATGESMFEGRLGFLKNSSEVWEESKDADYDPCSVTIADPGILISPSSSLLSGLDLLGGTTSPHPEVIEIPKRSRPHQATTSHNECFLDFPTPPTIVPNRRTSFGESRPIGRRSLMVSPLSNPALAVSYESIPQPSRYSQSSTLQRRWSALPPAEFHLDSRRISRELAMTKSTGAIWTKGTKRPDTHLNTPVVPRVPPFVASYASHGSGLYGEPSPRRRTRRKEKPEPLTSFMDMSTTESTLTKSRVHKLFSKISGGLKARSKRHY